MLYAASLTAYKAQPVILSANPPGQPLHHDKLSLALP